jgi:hypothetical protein
MKVLDHRWMGQGRKPAAIGKKFLVTFGGAGGLTTFRLDFYNDQVARVVCDGVESNVQVVSY